MGRGARSLGSIPCPWITELLFVSFEVTNEQRVLVSRIEADTPVSGHHLTDAELSSWHRAKL